MTCLFRTPPRQAVRGGVKWKGTKMQGKYLLDQRWQCYIYICRLHKMNHSIFQHFTHFYFLLFVSHLDKNPSNAKPHTHQHTVWAGKQWQRLKASCFEAKHDVQSICVFNACAHKDTLSITATPTQNPHSDVCTYLLYICNQLKRSLTNQHAINYTLALSFGRLAAELESKYSWKASDLYCQDKLENERISEGKGEFKWIYCIQDTKMCFNNVW